MFTHPLQLKGILVFQKDMLITKLLDTLMKTGVYNASKDNNKQVLIRILLHVNTSCLHVLYRAFEDDDSVTVIEQSPNTSETRARPSGPSLVIVQMEPTFEEIQEVSQPTADHYSVTVETHPEPIVDTKVWNHTYEIIVKNVNSIRVQVKFCK